MFDLQQRPAPFRAKVRPDQRLAPLVSEGDPILGHLRQLRRDPLALFARAQREHGDVARLHFGSVVAHVVSSPELVRAVLTERTKVYTPFKRGSDVADLVLGNGLLTSDGEFWLRQRRIAAPAFHRKRIDALAPTFVAVARSLDARLVDGEVVDVHREMMRVALLAVAETLFGAGLQSEIELIADAASTFNEEINLRTSAALSLPVSWPLPRYRRFRNHLAAVDAVVYGMIERRRADPGSRADLLSVLIGARDPESGEAMTDRQLRDEVMTILLAGHETSANLLAWAFHLLAAHPDVRERLEAEVDRVVGSRAPTIDDVPALELTQWIVDETLRLYPPAWALVRDVDADDELGGFLVPRGGYLLISPWVMHRRTDLWADAALFDPDRFSPARANELPHKAFMPFGGGPRLCIGQGFARLEAQLVLATIAQRFRFDAAPGFEAVPEPIVTLRPRGGLPMIARFRAPA